MTRILALALLATPAAAETCFLRADMVAGLTSAHQEPLALGLSGNGAVMVELWVSRETGTFTVVGTNGNGVSCILAAGTDWMGAPLPVTGEPS